MKIKITTRYKKILSDTYTPVAMYLKLRDEFPGALLLESSDYKDKLNHFSYLCLDAMASFDLKPTQMTLQYPDESQKFFEVKTNRPSNVLTDFINEFDVEKVPFDYITQGFFGYTTYDAIPYFEKIVTKPTDLSVPLMQYQLHRLLIVFNHFHNELILIEHSLEGDESKFETLEQLINHRAVQTYQFELKNEEKSNFTDAVFLEKINQGQSYCYTGDVFQLVLSRKFYHEFQGDEFNVYRALSSINPSPYLFYFDYVNFKIFGSSPEAQLTVANKKATIHPIAGTFRRTGNLEQDKQLAQQLSEDPKENAEHVMLVDLARNDLSKNSENVEVTHYKEIEFYSHVIHLVSKVTAQLIGTENSMRIFEDTFPAGTLSGAPKHRAMELIDSLENESRGFYGGAIGFIGFDGTLNHAIFIRSFVSKDYQLTYQAGCGIVTKSVPQSELEEVDNKISALRKALQLAENL